MVLEAFTADEVESVASQLRDAANRLSMVATRMRKTPGMDVAYLHLATIAGDLMRRLKHSAAIAEAHIEEQIDAYRDGRESVRSILKRKYEKYGKKTDADSRGAAEKGAKKPAAKVSKPQNR